MQLLVQAQRTCVEWPGSVSADIASCPAGHDRRQHSVASTTRGMIARSCLIAWFATDLRHAGWRWLVRDGSPA